jgi:hypothetical protein|tara:strand:- start:150 stop:572 length:423 start_codon:yes stop_codon:yes gene_type:complete
MRRERISELIASRKLNWKGVSFPMVLGSGGFISQSQGFDTIVAGLKQLILTTKGERVMRPNFGTNLRRYVFEPMDGSLKKKIKKDISLAVANYEPRVVLKDISVTFDRRVGKEDLNSILISLLLALKGDLSEDRILEIIL